MNKARKLFFQICKNRNVTPEEMRGEGRRQHIVDARREFYFKASRMGLSSSQVAKIINKDPSTIRHHLRKTKSPFVKIKPRKISLLSKIFNFLMQKVNA